jgi:hypothetical protein
MDDTGFFMLRDWVDHAKTPITIMELSKRLHVARRTIRDNLRWLIPPSQRGVFNPPPIAPAKIESLNARRQLVFTLAKQTHIAVGRHITPKLRKVTFHDQVMKTYPSVSALVRTLGVDHNIIVSKATVLRDLALVGLTAKVRRVQPYLTETHKKNRLAFCNSFLPPNMAAAEFTKYVERMLFSDEKWARRNKGQSKFQWCEPDEVPLPRYKDQDDSFIRVWGIIGVGFSKLIILPAGKIDKNFYIHHMLTAVLGKLQKQGAVFMQDGASVHTAAIPWLRQHGVIPINWPSKSPDLNPIENLWARVQGRVNQHGPWGTDDLEAFWNQEWEGLEESEVDNLVRSFKRRVKDVSDAEGDQAPQR